MLAREIMSRDVITVIPEEKVDKAARILVDNKISGLPVVDADDHVVGIITEKDLIVRASELKVPFYLTLFDSIIFLDNPIRFNNDIKKYTASQVKDAMTRKVYVVEEDTPVSEIVEIMQKRAVNRVPVVRNDKLVGIITRNDILKTLVKSNG
ncbi:MAG: CBS domain-containing protein [Syntrophomonadaceae bacterium]|nr:CBS domain-containing protein [Syntrophomonadaceae bacterium]MDD3271181.1 CBS domain-containing protein [Syntrophomonadaceae bacterium]MDD3897672.1 CBS domain-containing protein [Syntrophomonadaceae bacterium]MDD4561694.1 CBS domain-containing protein [Syntrophomonadaceae bacterium]